MGQSTSTKFNIEELQGSETKCVALRMSGMPSIIVIVEDDLVSLKLLVAMIGTFLKKKGLKTGALHNIFISIPDATRIEHLLQRHQGANDILCFVDFSLGGPRTGAEVLKQFQMAFNDPVLVGMSSNTDNRVKMHEAGAAYFLKKPFLRTQIYGLLEHVTQEPRGLCC